MAPDRRPLLGITTYAPTDDGRYELPAAYVAAVRRAGGLAVLLPTGDVAAGDLLDRLDGLILSGGGDVDPARYGAEPHAEVYGCVAERDQMEIDLVHELLARGTPTLAICRGCQVLNVALGGTLVQHVPDITADVAHRLIPRAPTPHPVAVERGTRTAELMGATDVVPMSWHHQAVDRPGEGLRVVARAPDGIVEALEHDSHPFLVSVQWHPELSADRDPTQQRLFDALVGAAADRTPGGSP